MVDGARNFQLDAFQFTLGQAAFLSQVAEKSVRNWSARGVLSAGQKHFTGRTIYCLRDVIRLAIMNDLTTRVPLKPSDAVGAAEMFVREIVKYAPEDVAGNPILDLNTVPRGLALVFATLDGELQVGLVDPTQPGYGDPAGSWARAHVMLPIAATYAAIAYRLFSLPAAESAQ